MSNQAPFLLTYGLPLLLKWHERDCFLCRKVGEITVIVEWNSQSCCRNSNDSTNTDCLLRFYLMDWHTQLCTTTKIALLMFKLLPDGTFHCKRSLQLWLWMKVMDSGVCSVSSLNSGTYWESHHATQFNRSPLYCACCVQTSYISDKSIRCDWALTVDLRSVPRENI